MLTLSAFSFPARVTKRKLHFNCHSFASLTAVDSQRRSDIEDDRALTPLLREGVVSDQNELARLAHVSQSRMTQIMNLSHLAPEIQEAILFLSLVTSGRDRGTVRLNFFVGFPHLGQVMLRDRVAW